MSRDFEEKRDFIRMCIDGPMSFTRRGETMVHTATAKDLSGGGLRFVCAVPLAEGELLEVAVVPGTTTVPPLRAEVQVVRVDEQGTGTYDVGAAIRRFL